MSNQNQQTTRITTVGEAQQSQVACQDSSQFNYCKGIIAHNINIENVQHLSLTSKQSEAINSAEQNQTTIERIQNATFELKEKLQECYKDVTLPCVAWLDKGEDLVMSHHYTELQLDVTEIQITIEQLFEKIEHDKEPRRILIEGQPGYGKTTLATKLIYDWALSKNYIKHFKLAFFIPLRELENKTIDDTLIEIANCAKFEDTSLVHNIIQENISDVLLILDGLDELQESDQISILKLLREKQYFQMTVIVTCRTGLFKVKHTGGISRKEIFYDKQVHVLGIEIEKRKEFLLKFIPSEDADRIINQINNLTRFVVNMFRSPLFLILLAYIAMYKNNIGDEEDEESALTSKTNLFKRLFNCIINRSLKSEADNQFDLFKFDSTTQEIQKTIQQFGKTSLDQLLHKKMQFKCNKLTQEVYKMGFLINQQKMFKLQTITHYEAFHLSILEFSAAFSIWMDYKQQICESPQNSFECVHKYYVMLNDTSLIPNFLIGLFQDEASEFYNQLSPYAHLFSSCQYKLFNLLLEYNDNISWERVIPSVTNLIPQEVELQDKNYAQLYSSELFENLLIHGVTSHKIKQIRITNNTPVRLPKNTTIPHLYLKYYSESSHNIQETLIGIKCSKLTVSFNPSSTNSNESAILNILGLFASIPANSYSFMFSGRKDYKVAIYSHIDDVNQIKYTDFEIVVFNTAAKNLTVNLLRRNQIKNLHVYLDSSLDQCDVDNIFTAVANSSYLQSLYIGLDDSNGMKYIDLHDLTKKGTRKYNVLMVKTGSFLCKGELKNKKCIHSMIINQQSANIYNFSMVNPTVFECYLSNFWEFTQPWVCFKYLKKLVLVVDLLYVLSNNEDFWCQLSGCENLKILELYFPNYETEKYYANEEEIISYFQQVPIETFIIWNVKATNDVTNKILKTITDCLLFKKINLSLKTITLNFTYVKTDYLEQMKIFSSIMTDLLECLKLHHLKAVNIICTCKNESPWDSLMQLNIIDYSIFEIKHSILGYNSDDESEYNRIICKQYDLLTYHTFSIRLKQENVDLNRSIWFNAFRFLPFFNKI